MYKNRRIAVIIAAAGSGKRMGGGVPKQYKEIGGVPILIRSIRAFAENPLIDILCIVTRDEDQEYCRSMLEKYSIRKAALIVPGGAERQDSVCSALNALPEECDYVLIHDGARPFVTETVIRGVLEKTLDAGAAVCGVPMKDTVKVIRRVPEKRMEINMTAGGIPIKDTVKIVERRSENDVMKSGDSIILDETLDRSKLYSIQTPQGFHIGLLKEAFKKADEDGVCGTDDAVLVEHLGRDVALVMGDYHNIKVTTVEDLLLAEVIASERDEVENMQGELAHINERRSNGTIGFRLGNGYDVHAFAADRKLILGGVEIPHEKGLLGHSDADVLIHALMDAMLGAAALGDIGRHFPDSDERFKGISSMKLLAYVDQLLDSRGYYVGNVDITVIAQRPKLLPYLSEMIKNIAEVLQIDESQINIKGTTTEKLGFCGREEGIAAQASALLYRK